MAFVVGPEAPVAKRVGAQRQLVAAGIQAAIARHQILVSGAVHRFHRAHIPCYRQTGEEQAGQDD